MAVVGGERGGVECAKLGVKRKTSRSQTSERDEDPRSTIYGLTPNLGLPLCILGKNICHFS